MTIGEQIKGLRKRLGLTQKEFSDRIGLSLGSLVRYEGGSEPKGATRTIIERVLAAGSMTDLSGQYPPLEGKATPIGAEASPRVRGLLRLAEAVLASEEEPYATALAQNIKAFHDAVAARADRPPESPFDRLRVKQQCRCGRVVEQTVAELREADGGLACPACGARVEFDMKAVREKVEAIREFLEEREDVGDLGRKRAPTRGEGE